MTRWGKYAAAYAASTGLVQIFGAISTFVYVRYLSVDQYGIFGLALTTIAFIALISDLGLTGALAYFKRESNRSRGSFSAIVAAVKLLRRIFYVCALALGLTTLTWSLYARHGGAAEVGMVLTLVAAISYSQLNLSIGQTLLRLSNKFSQSYRADIAGAALRLMLALIVYALLPPHVGVLLATIFAGTLAAMLLARPESVGSDAKAQKDDVRAVARFVLPTSPSVVLLATQEMIIYFAAWWIGGAGPVASVFAIGRISALLSLLGGFFNVVVVSKLSGVTSTRRTLVGGYGFVALLGTACLAAITMAWLFPTQILLIIGPNYAGLGMPLLLGFCSASLSMLAQAVGQLNRIVGWVLAEPVAASIQFIAMISAVPFFDLSDPEGLLSLWVAINAVYLTLNILTSVLGICAPRLLSLSSRS